MVNQDTTKFTIFSQNSGKFDECKVCKTFNFGIIVEKEAGERIDFENNV